MKDEERDILLIFKSSEIPERDLKEVTQEKGLSFRVVSSLKEVEELLERVSFLGAIFSESSPLAVDFSHLIRTNPATEELPLLAVINKIADEIILQCFEITADDFIPVSEFKTQLKLKLESIQRGIKKEERKEANKGKVLLGGENHIQRALYGRVLRDLGFEVEFVLNEEEVKKALKEKPYPRLFILDDSFPPQEGVALLHKLKEETKGLNLPSILLVPPESISSVKERMRGLLNVRLHSSKRPPEDIVFTVNALTNPKSTLIRKTQRILYGTKVRYTCNSIEVPVWGFIYNINLTGLFIRTLTPPALGERVFLKFCPPFSTREVSFESKVVWRKEFIPFKGRSYPSGMGVVFIKGNERDYNKFKEGYKTLLNGVQR